MKKGLFRIFSNLSKLIYWRNPTPLLGYGQLDTDIKRLGGRPDHALLIISICHFDKLNSILSIEQVAEILNILSERLNADLQTPIHYKIENQSFSFLIRNCQDTSKLKAYHQHITRILSKPIDTGTLFYTCDYLSGASFINCNDSGDSIKSALYALHSNIDDKQDLTVFDKTLESRKHQENRTLLEFTLALSRKEFSLVFQPKYNLSTNTIVGIEALARWNTEEEILSPDSFIPYLSSTARLLDLTHEVINNAIIALLELKRNNIKIPISINIHPSFISSPGNLYAVKKKLVDSGLLASDLQFEITEHSLIELDTEFKALSELRNFGFKVLIDDFGTGYSSLSCISKLPADIIKIDRSFIKNIDNSLVNRTIVSSIVNIANSRGLTVVAEGIETEAELLVVKNLNCNIGQGFFLSTPLRLPKLIDSFS